MSARLISASGNLSTMFFTLESDESTAMAAAFATCGHPVTPQTTKRHATGGEHVSFRIGEKSIIPEFAWSGSDMFQSVRGGVLAKTHPLQLSYNAAHSIEVLRDRRNKPAQSYRGDALSIAVPGDIFPAVLMGLGFELVGLEWDGKAKISVESSLLPGITINQVHAATKAACVRFNRAKAGLSGGFDGSPFPDDHPAHYAATAACHYRNFEALKASKTFAITWLESGSDSQRGALVTMDEFNANEERIVSHLA